MKKLWNASSILFALYTLDKILSSKIKKWFRNGMSFGNQSIVYVATTVCLSVINCSPARISHSKLS